MTRRSFHLSSYTRPCSSASVSDGASDGASDDETMMRLSHHNEGMTVGTTTRTATGAFAGTATGAFTGMVRTPRDDNALFMELVNNFIHEEIPDITTEEGLNAYFEHERREMIARNTLPDETIQWLFLDDFLRRTHRKFFECRVNVLFCDCCGRRLEEDHISCGFKGYDRERINHIIYSYAKNMRGSMKDFNIEKEFETNPSFKRKVCTSIGMHFFTPCFCRKCVNNPTLNLSQAETRAQNRMIRHFISNH